MQPVRSIFFALAAIAISLCIACNNTETTTEVNAGDTTATNAADSTPGMAYDPAMDPYLVGGDQVKKLHDSLGIKLYLFTMKPGDSATMHSHPDHAVYVLQGGKLAVTFQGMGRQIMEFKEGIGFVGGPLSDAAKNIGNTTVKMLIADIYRPRDKDNSTTAMDPALDPVTVGGSSVKLLADSLNIRMFEAILKPGETAPLHAHPDHAIYVLQGGQIMLYPKGGNNMTAPIEKGKGWVGGPLTDSARNTGKTPIRILEIAVHRSR